MQFNLEDPATWPEDGDIDGLAKLATGDVEDSAPREAELVTGDGDEVPSEKSEARPEETPKEKQEEESEQVVTTIDGIPVLSKDGKHAIPFSVLEQARKKAAEREAELQKRDEELREYKEKLAALDSKPSQAEQPEPKASDDSLDEQTEAVAKAIEEEYGKELADDYRRGALLQRRFSASEQQRQAEIAALKKELDEVKTAFKSREDERKQSEEAQIQSAIDNSPTMAQWQSDENSPWWDTSIDLYRTLVARDERFRDMSIQERFAELPKRVKAVFPDAPLIEPESEPAIDRVVKAKQEAAAKKAPASLSDVSGAQPGAEKSPVERLASGDLSDDEIMKLVNGLSNAEDLDAFIAEVS